MKNQKNTQYKGQSTGKSVASLKDMMEASAGEEPWGKGRQSKYEEAIMKTV